MITLAGCASTPNTADIMRAHAADAQDQVDLKNQLAKDWSRGAKMVQSGEKRVKNGEKKVKSAENDLKDGQAQVEQGNQEIAEGRKLMQESEQHFHENFPKLELKSTN
ncbi:MAG: hypothetical protein ABI475_11395 [Methylophilaceae bacterium]